MKLVGGVWVSVQMMRSKWLSREVLQSPYICVTCYPHLPLLQDESLRIQISLSLSCYTSIFQLWLLSAGRKQPQLNMPCTWIKVQNMSQQKKKFYWDDKIFKTSRNQTKLSPPPHTHTKYTYWHNKLLNFKFKTDQANIWTLFVWNYAMLKIFNTFFVTFNEYMSTYIINYCTNNA